MAESDKLILQEFNWDAYKFMPASFKPHIEGCLLTQIVIQSTDGRIDQAYSQWDKCAEVLTTSSEFRELLLQSWKEGSFDRVRDSTIIHKPKDEPLPVSGTTVIHHGSTFTEVHGDSYTINDYSHYRSERTVRWLCDYDYSAIQKTTYQRRTDGTCEWFFTSAGLKLWLEDERKRLLWCPGMPGVGKTVLASTMVQYLEHLGQGPVCFVYLNYKRRSQQSLVHIIGAILRGLYERHDFAFEIIKDLFGSYAHSHSSPTFKELFAALQTVVDKTDICYIVLDGLDEYLEQYSDEAVETLRDTLMSLPRVKLVITSRIIGNMKKIFNVPYAVYQDIYTSDADMTAYLKDRILKEVPQRFRKDLQDTVVESIMKVAKQRFLLAKLHMDLVTSRLTLGEMRDTLQSLSEEVDHVYRQAIERINNQGERHRNLAHIVLMWVACSRRSLTITELQHVLAVAPGEPRRDIKQYIYPEELLTSVCAGLVVINEAFGVVQFVHYTAQEFFERTRNEYFPDADVKIATACCHYILINPYPYSDGPSFVFTLLDNLPFYKYISEHFHAHLKSCNFNPLELLCREDDDRRSRLVTGVKVFMAIKCMEGHRERYRWSSGSWSKAHFMAALDHVSLLEQVMHEDDASKEKEWSTGLTPLSCAIKAGAMLAVRFLLMQEGVDINGADRKQEGLLSLALRHGQLEVADMLLEWADIDLNAKDVNGRTPLHVAVIYDRFDIFKKLIAKPQVDVNATDKGGETPIFHATRYRQEQMTRILLQDPRVVYNARNEDGRSPLMIAIAEQVVPMVDILLEKDSFSYDFKDNNRRTFLSWAAGNGLVPLTRTLISLPHSPVNEPDSSGRTPLSHAASGGHTEIVSLLISTQGVDVHSVDSAGATPLFYASQFGATRVVQSLLSTGDRVKPSINLKDKEGRTPLSTACERCHPRIAEQLLRFGADVNSRDLGNHTPLHHASTNGTTALMRLLVSHGAEINTKDESGRSPLHECIRSWRDDNLEDMTALLDAGADINSQDNNGWTPLMDAVFFDRIEKAKTLKQRGAKLDIRDNNGRHVLFYAASHSPAWFLKELATEMERIDAGINSKDNTGWTPLMSALAAVWRDADLGVGPCIEAGANVNAQDDNGRTSISRLAEYDWYWDEEKFKAVVERLVEAGADINLADNEGKTPLDFCVEKNRQSAIEFFEGLGAKRGVIKEEEGGGDDPARNGELATPNELAE